MHNGLNDLFWQPWQMLYQQPVTFKRSGVLYPYDDVLPIRLYRHEWLFWHEIRALVPAWCGLVDMFFSWCNYL